jgi:hypothetical protein
MTVTVDAMVFLIGKQAIELDQLRRENESLRAAVAERDQRIKDQTEQAESATPKDEPRG